MLEKSKRRNNFTMKTLKLNNGVEIPAEGYGVFQIPDAAECERSVLDAIQSGYRMIDTAAAYFNEEAVGRAIRKSGVKREDLFISTKLWVQDASYEGAKRAVSDSLAKLNLDYIDLYLIHQPFGDYYGAWRAMEEMLAEGKLRAIGVCNFESDRLVDLILNNKVVPAVNQIELHPFHQQDEALEVMKEYGVVPEAWGPLAEGQKDIFNNPVLKKIADAHGRTVAQVILRWNVQRGVVVIPKSTKKSRMEENIGIWDFELTKSEMAQIKTLDVGHSEIIDHHSVNIVKYLNGVKVHD